MTKIEVRPGTIRRVITFVTGCYTCSFQFSLGDCEVAKATDRLKEMGWWEHQERWYCPVCKKMHKDYKEPKNG